MKKLLTILTLLVAVALQGFATSRTVWAGKQAISWAETPPEGAIQLDTYGSEASHPYRGIFQGLKANDVIKITVTDNESSPQYSFKYKSGNNWEWTDLTFTGPTENVLSYTIESEEMATYISDRGLVISGENYAITQIEIEGYDTSSTTWEGYVAISWNTSAFAGIQFDTKDQMSLTGLSANDIIKITYIVEENQTKQYELDYKAGDSWVWTALSSNITDENNILSYTVPDTDMATLLADRGLIIKGQYFYITKIEVEKASSTTQYTLTVTQPTNGSGTIQIGGADAATQAYDEGTELSLAAVPISNYQLSEWSSTTEGVVTDENKSTSPLEITMNQDINITASFSVIDAKILDWIHEYESGALRSAAVGDKVRITFTNTDGSSGMNLKVFTKTAGWDYNDAIYDAAISTTTYDVEVTNENQEDISARGLFIQGNNITLQSVEVIKSYTVTVSSVTGGTIAVKNGDTPLVEGNNTIESGTSLTLTAEADNTHNFSNWVITVGSETDNSKTNATDSYTVTSDVTIGATFTSAVSALSDGESRTLFENAEGETMSWNEICDTKNSAWGSILAEGDQIVVTVSEKTGSEYPKVNLRDANSATVGTDISIDDVTSFPYEAIYTLTSENVTAMAGGFCLSGDGIKVTKVVLRRPAIYTLTITAPTNGSFTVNDGSSDLETGASVKQWTKLTLTATPSGGYSFSKFTVGGTDYTDNPYTFEMTDNTTVAATFTSGVSALTTGESRTLFENAEGEAMSWNEICDTKNSAWGSILVEGDQIVVIVSEKTGSEYPKVNLRDANSATVGTDISMDDVTSFPYEAIYTLTSENVTALANGFCISGDGIKVTKVVLRRPATYTLTITAPANGSFTVNDGTNDLETGASVKQWTKLTLSATADNGYSFTKWTINEVDYTDNPYTLNVTDNVTIKAVFEAESSTLTKLSEGETRTVWTSTSSEGDAISWSEYSDTKNANWGGILEAGEIFKFYVASTTGDDRQIVLRDASSTAVNTINPDVITEATVVEMQLTAEMVEKLANGFCFSGVGYTITKVELYKPAAVTPVFDSEGKADLSKVEKYGTNVTYTYSEGVGTIASASQWEGVYLNLENESPLVSGAELEVTMQENSNFGVYVVYTDNTATDGSADVSGSTESGKTVTLELNKEKKIKQIQIKSHAAGTTTLKLTNITLKQTSSTNTEKTLTTAVTPEGSGSVKVQTVVGETVTDTEDTSFASGTVLKLTAIANSGYAFSKWMSGDTELAANSDKTLTVTMDEDKTITAVFTQKENSSSGTITLDNLDNGWGSSYNASTKTITFDDAWQGRGWTIDSNIYNDKKSVLVKFNAVEYDVKLVIEYYNSSEEGATTTTVDETASAGKTEVEVAIPEDVVKITKVYLSNSAAGTLTLTEATVTEISEATSTLFDSDGKADLSKLESQNTEKVTVSVSDGKATVVATEGWTGVQLTVADGETVSGKEIKITMSEAKALKVTVKKNSEDAGTDFNLDAAAVQYIEFDEATSIYQIQIQPTEAATLVIEEIKVNSESTKPADPVVTPVFTDGVADLSKFEVQDAEKVTYDATTHTITVTEGWTGVQATITEGEKVSGKELRITFAEASKVKVAVSYTDETKADDVIMSEAATICYVTLDNTKNVYQIQIQPTDAGSVTLKEVIVKAEATPQTTSLIDKFSADESDEAVTYTGHVMTTTEDNKYIQAWISGDNISGKRLVIATTGDNPPIMNILVQYNGDNEKPIVYAGNTSTSSRTLKLDDTKTIQKVQIYLPTKGNVTFSEIYIDNEDNSNAEAAMFKLTTTAVNGQITVKKDGETGNTDNREFEYGTKLTLTATADEGYEFSKWLKDGEAAGTSATLSLTMDADVTIEAVFKGSKLSNEERRTLWESATGETLTWSDMMVQPAEVGEIVEAGEILIITTSAVDTSEGHYPKIDLRDKDGNSLASIDPLVKGENRLSITSAMATKMAGGFKFQGESATLTRLELYKPTPITKLAEGDSKTLWQNADGATLSWNTIAIDRAAEWGSVLEEDERIIISVKAKESGDDIWPTIQLQDLDGQKLASTATLLNDVTVPGDIVITLTAEMVEKLKNGFSITGDKATITSAILYKPVLPTKTVKTLNDTETAITTDDLVTVAAAKLANISPYDVLTVNFAITAETAKLVIKCNGENGGWDYIKEMEFKDGETLFALPLTESAVNLLKANGLGITGSGYTFKSVTIKTAGEVADDATEEDDISNANASENTKKVYNVLKDLYGKKIVSGVVANIDWNTTEAENVYEWTGKYPAMNVFDYINLHASKDVNSEGWLDYSDITPAKNWWQEGGIVGAMWHWQMKANNGTDYTCTPGTAADETSFDASKVYVDGTSENTLAKQQLDQLCGYFAKMQEAGIPVVWRPLHEGSGNVEQYTGGTAWFWWGAKGADVYKKLWQWMYNYMVTTKGLNNLIWVWTSQTNDKNWYPGDAYVDIIGRDNYGATAAKLATEYEELKEAYPNKMITLAECGNSDDAEMATISSIWDEGSRWSWFMTWYDNDYNEGKTTTHKHTSKTWWTNAVAKDYVVTRDQMKELLGQDDSGDETTGVNISLDNLNEGWSSTYDATTKTITTTGEWAARGWYIGDNRYSSKGSITVKYEAVQFGVTLKMEYTNSNGESKSVSAGAAAGETEVELDIPSDVKTIEKVYITYQPIGTLKLTAATVNDKVVDNRTEKTLVEKEAKIADGDIKINRGLFSNAVAKDVIRIYATGLSDASKIALEPGDYSGAIDGANWTSFTESPFELKLTESVLATIKEKGLLVRGESFTFTKAVLYTESDLGSEISDGGGDDSGDDSGDSGNSSDSSSSTTTTDETVFDQKDGEADLTKFAAQDEKTTTVTYDKQEGTLTITTTEDYKAAQIWFNTPEEVTGNVLEVEIAEAGVNVTITVGYTDGSESVMSSVVNAARAVAMTRGGSGTKIVVPLDEGKEIQKIEVKNAKAGTITINSMTMTTQNVFTNYKANLSMMKPQSGATYDVSTYTLATTKGWTGVTLTPLESETVKGAELLIRFQGEATVKVAVKYRTDEDGPSTIMEQADASVRLALNPQKEIQEITVQPTTASVLTFAEMAVYPEKGMGGLLSEGETLEVWSGNESLSWNEIARQGKNIGAELQEYDEILVTISSKAAGNDWPKVFLRDANYEMVGTEILLNEVETFPYVARFVLTKALVEKLKNGFAICGDGVTVTKVEIYRPYPPKKGDIHLRALDYGYGSEYDAATNTITTTQRWAARGWEIGDSRYNNKDLVLVQFEAVGFPVTLKMEYVDAYGQKQATSAGVAAGNTEVRLTIPSGIKQMDRAYIIYQNPGSLTLTNAEVITALQASSRGITEDSRGISISGGNSFRPDGSRSTDDDAWYTLSGQRIEKPTAKGVYIHNGKTVVVHE